jgi:hypothetical protein
VVRSAGIDGTRRGRKPMTSLEHSVLVLVTTLLSLSILFLGGYIINLLSQKAGGVDNGKILNNRITRISLFERAAIAGTITALYGILMIAFFIFMSSASLR